MKTRNWGIDLLRIVSMIMIVILHILGQGGILGAANVNSADYHLGWFFEIASYCAVNCYALISGYVGIGAKHKYKNIFSLYLQVAFYSVIITLLFFMFVPGKVSILSLIKSPFVIAFPKYWYFTAYFCMFFFIPFLNFLVDNLSQKQLKTLLFTIIILFCVLQTFYVHEVFGTEEGYNAIWLSSLYLIGAYIKKYGMFKTVTKSYKFLLIYLACIVATYLSKVFLENITPLFLGDSYGETKLISYTSPTILLAAIALLMFFANLKITPRFAKVIGFFAPLSFSCYLIHTNPLVFAYLSHLFVPYIKFPAVIMILLVIATAILIYLACAFIDWIRFWLFKLIRVNTFCEWLERTLKKLFKKGLSIIHISLD